MAHAGDRSGSGAFEDRGQRSDLGKRARSLLEHRAARSPEAVRSEEKRSIGERLSDGFVRAAGSWRFIIGFLVVLAAWLVVNAIAGVRHWDPYPFILLNLILSCVAAIQAPIILMSQNREEARDRMSAEADYQVNLKTEILLEHLTQEVEALRMAIARYGEKEDKGAQ